MKKFFFISLIFSLFLAGCCTRRAVQIETTTRDTVFVSEKQTDTVFISDSVDVRVIKDTVFVTKVKRIFEKNNKENKELKKHVKEEQKPIIIEKEQKSFFYHFKKWLVLLGFALAVVLMIAVKNFVK